MESTQLKIDAVTAGYDQESALYVMENGYRFIAIDFDVLPDGLENSVTPMNDLQDMINLHDYAAKKKDPGQMATYEGEMDDKNYLVVAQASGSHRIDFKTENNQLKIKLK